jgi:hypothetical protein
MKYFEKTAFDFSTLIETAAATPYTDNIVDNIVNTVKAYKGNALLNNRNDATRLVDRLGESILSGSSTAANTAGSGIGRELRKLQHGAYSRIHDRQPVNPSWFKKVFLGAKTEPMSTSAKIKNALDRVLATSASTADTLVAEPLGAVGRGLNSLNTYDPSNIAHVKDVLMNRRLAAGGASVAGTGIVANRLLTDN